MTNGDAGEKAVRRGKPWYQRAITYGAGTFSGLIILGALLDAISNASALLTARHTYFGTGIVGIVGVGVHLLLHWRPVRWTSRDGQRVPIKKMGPVFWSAIAGMLILLWLPRLMGLWTADAEGISLGLWKYKRRTIVIIKNENVQHINSTANAFQAEIESVLGPYTKIIEGTGSANSDTAANETNARVFEAALQEAEMDHGQVDLLVTVGTQVSIFAAERYSTRPRFFVAVTDPEDSGLVHDGEKDRRTQNVAGFANGHPPQTLLADLRDCFPGKVVGFLYSSNQRQDRQVLAFLKEKLPSIVPIEATDSFVISAEDKGRVDIVFGWNYLNTNIARYSRANPDVSFVGSNPGNIRSDRVVLSYGPDFRSLGIKAAKFVLDRHFEKGEVLGMLPIQYPDLTMIHVDEDLMRKNNIILGKKCRAKAKKSPPL